MRASQVELQGVDILIDTITMVTLNTLLVLVLGLYVSIYTCSVYRLLTMRACYMCAGLLT